jgi:GNAT superfamily N-acetyltransferase
MLDKSVPSGKAIMIKYDVENYPRFALPEGFYITGYRDGLEKEWAIIELEQQDMGSLERAEETFRKAFMSEPQWLKDRCLFVMDGAKNKVAAVISLWIGTLVDEPHNRVHWIATKEEYQGLGLIKGALTYVMDLYHRLGQTGYIYLTTQTYSYKAINIYKKFGFEPYLGQLHSADSDFDRDKHMAAWAVIDGKIAEYKNRNK